MRSPSCRPCAAGIRSCRRARGAPGGWSPSTPAGCTLAYFGAYDVHRAHLVGTTAPATGIAPFEQLVAKVMTSEPYA
ncbi:MAG: hypothetical protein M3P34_06725 [Actinomycetota bacterium]|jgi:hypothetical protein|nr:hypothetical protein [Actinomycetota bacterium]